ncbi:MAG: DUF4097 family beta strand repeat-containing protein [Erysipelotrichaceae bacterium]|nr:DUF4097 family beta strand repeat-containing protein [Erysipelotrichaceae bacterium]
MNRGQYLSELSRKLAGYPEDFRQEILDSFRQHFADGQAEGKNDEEIIRNLGSVDEVAENIEYYDQSRETGSSDPFRDLSRGIGTIGKAVKDIFTSLSATNINFSFSSGPKEFVEFADWQGAEEILFDANLADCDVSVSAGDTLRYAFSTNCPDDIRLNAEREGQRISFSIDRNLKIFPTVSGHLYLEVPQEIQNIYINASSGDVDFSRLDLNNIIVNTLNGDIDLREVACSECVVKATSGDLDVNDCRFRQLSVEVTSGDIDVRDSCGDLMINATSGDCDIRNHEGRILIKATSGDIDISMSHACDISCETKSGDIELAIADRNFRAEVSTVSGDIDTGHISALRRNRGHYLVGDGDASIVLRTLSGDITITD